MRHSLSTSIHQGAYYTSTDPNTTYPERMQTGILWIDTTGTPYVLKRRNAGNDGWDTIGYILGSAVAGDGLGHSSGVLSVTVDDSTLEINTDTVRQKDAGTTNAKLANMAQSTIKGRASGAGTGAPTDLTATQATAILDAFTGDSGAGGVKGLVPAPAAGDAAAGKVLQADGTWSVASGGAPGGSAGGVLDGTYPNPGLAASVAGSGLSESSDVLSVNVDGSTIEINSDTLRVKDAGITVEKLENDAKSATFNIALVSITVGQKVRFRVGFDCTITKVSILADASGDLVLDIWKDTHANAPPTDADSITSASPPTLSGAQKMEDSTLASWTTSITAGDWLIVNVDSVATLTEATLAIDTVRA